MKPRPYCRFLHLKVTHSQKLGEESCRTTTTTQSALCQRQWPLVCLHLREKCQTKHETVDMSGVCANGDVGDIYVSARQLDERHQLFYRFRELGEFYRDEFGSQPQFFVRVPGRVNIIGEHVDYCGYPVLPMAIDQCIILAVGHTDSNSLLDLRNLQNKKFQNHLCDLADLRIELPPTGGPEWYKYYLCGVKGIVETLGDQRCCRGMTVALSGNIPLSSGLSSSSALVSAAVLATAIVHRVPLERKRLASISASCERYIGTQGGGMDQAIAYLAQEGCAQLIEFHPELKATPVQLPKGAFFVVINSLAEVNKAASSDFNERVVECRLAARLIARHKGLKNWRQVVRFVQIQDALKCDLDELERLTLQHISLDHYNRSQLCDRFEMGDAEFEQEFLTPNTRHMDVFKLRQRALHVIQESLRVRHFRRICEQCAAGPDGDSGPIEELSQLMRQSHQSLKTLYECSHPYLDKLVQISDECGIGARLTGAGWGGCIVALCNSAESSKQYIAALKDKYFSQLPAHIADKYRENDFRDIVFTTFPRRGAEIFTF